MILHYWRGKSAILGVFLNRLAHHRTRGTIKQAPRSARAAATAIRGNKYRYL